MKYLAFPQALQNVPLSQVSILDAHVMYCYFSVVQYRYQNNPYHGTHSIILVCGHVCEHVICTDCGPSRLKHSC